MPLIDVMTNEVIVEEDLQKIKSELGKAISIIPGKSETWLMINVQSEQLMYFKGTNDPCVMVEVKTYGEVDYETSNQLTKKITSIIERILHVSPNRVYVSYYSTEKWGYGGRNF